MTSVLEPKMLSGFWMFLFNIVGICPAENHGPGADITQGLASVAR